MSRKLILDLDTGIDDALAIAYALGSPEAELIGITATYGNVLMDRSVRNSLAVLDILGASSVPVHPGLPHSSTTEDFSVQEISAFIHGRNGVGEVDIAPSPRSAEATGAVDFIIEASHRYGDELVYIPTGPLTNLAAALEKDPGLAGRLRVVLMGGALTVSGNVSPWAEANISQDPDAADAVFRSGIDATMIGLDVTLQTLLTYEQTRRWRELGTPAGAFLADMTDYYIKAYETTAPGLGGCGLHDGGRRLRGRGRDDGFRAARPGRAIAQRLSHGTAGLSGRVEAFGHRRGGAYVDGSNLGNGARDGTARHVGRHGGHDRRGAAVGRLRGGSHRGCAGFDRFARGDVGGVVGIAGDALGEWAAHSTRQGRRLGATVAAGDARGVGRGIRGLSGRDRSGGCCGGNELGGNTLVMGEFLVRSFLADRLGRLVLLVGDDDGRDDVAGFMNGGLDDGHFVGRAAAEEEGAQLHGGLLCEDTADDLGRVRHASIAQDVAQGSGSASLGVPGAEDDAVDARGKDGARAHRAGLEGDDQRAAGQAPRSSGAARLAQGDDFGVACGVVVGLAAVPPASDDAAVLVDDDGSDGNVSRLAGAVGQEEGLAHCFAVLLIHGHPPSLPAKRLLG